MRRLYLFIRAIPKTLYFNLKYLPFKSAIKFPFFISHRVWLMETKGTVKINCEELKPAMIKIGFGEVGIFDQMRERSIWKVQGLVEFHGAASLGHGTKISVETQGRLAVGKDAIVTAESSIICTKEIVLEDEVMISWDVQIMDTDLHAIRNVSGEVINYDEKVSIGARSWIGSRAMILKGVNLTKGSVVAAGTVVSKSINNVIEKNENLLIGGNPPRIIKENVIWEK